MSYVDGFVAAVPVANKDAYIAFSRDAAAVFKDHGAQTYVECWGDDVPEGKLTSMPLAVQRKDDETVVFSWVVWPSRAVRDAGMQAVMDDPLCPKDMPFDGQRVIYGGFRVLVHA